MSWILVRVVPRVDAQIVIDALFAAGSQGVQEDGATLVTHFPPGTDVQHVSDAVHAADPAAVLDIGEAPAIDWSRAWQSRIGAHEVGGLTIAPPWLADAAPAERLVVIDPGMAFGTGEHATTRGVVRLLGGTVRPGDVVADLGAGSAVLAIAAVRLGAARAIAIENDPDAIPNAEENVARNGVVGRVHVIEGDAELLLPLVAPVRLVVANIISSVLVALLPGIGDALTPDGEAILSGILVEEREAMLDVLRSQGWTLIAEDREEQWWSARVSPRR